jgi:hypothetical protein
LNKKYKIQENFNHEREDENDEDDEENNDKKKSNSKFSKSTMVKINNLFYFFIFKMNIKIWF